ncbi:DHS-like NAD/FAD-binding domain-containing protein [Mycena floridula]|nr:DHS-like NAD/FAD-binding domain-containing protein [Mycena floridula]
MKIKSRMVKALSLRSSSLILDPSPDERISFHNTSRVLIERNNADYSVFINTGQEFDGSDSGARPDEAVSWGKIRAGAESVKVFADATLVFPLLVAATFARDVQPKV